MAKEKSIKLNYIYNLLYEVILIITPFITTPYVSRVLGADGIGLYSYTYSIVTYFILVAGLGTTKYGQREVSYFQHDIKARSIAFWNTELIRIIFTLLMLGVYLLFSFIQKENRSLYLVNAINLLNVALDITWFFQGIEEFGKIVGRNVVFRILTVLSIFLFVHEANDIVVYAICLAGLTALGSISLWPYLKGNIVKISWKQINIWPALRTTLTFFIPTIAIQVYSYMDKTMIGIITNDAFQNGYYEQAQKVIGMALTFITSVGTVMVPRMGYYYAQGKVEEVRAYLAKSFRFILLISIPMCFGIIAVASNFVPWFFGNGYEEVVTVLRITSVLLIVLGLNNVIGIQYLIPTGRQNLYTLCVVVGAVINLFSNAVLIPILGAEGAAIASVFAEFVICAVEMFLIKKEINLLSVLKPSIKYLTSGLIMFMGTILISNRLTSSILNTIIISVSGVIIYFAMLLILRDDFFISNIKLLRNKIPFVKKNV